MKPKLSAPHQSFIGTTKDNAYIYFIRGGHSLASARPIPPNPKTPDQLAQRAIIRTTAKTWQTLTPAQRQTWEDYIRAHATPNQSNRTAFDQYMLCNTKRQLLGENPITDAPATTTPPAAISLSIVPSPLSTVLNFTLQHPIPTTQLHRYQLLVKQTRPTPSPARAPQPKDANLIKGVTPQSATPLGLSGPTHVYTFTDIRYPIALRAYPRTPAARNAITAQAM